MAVIKLDIPAVEGVADTMNDYTGKIDNLPPVSKTESGSSKVDAAISDFGGVLASANTSWASDGRGVRRQIREAVRNMKKIDSDVISGVAP